MNEFDRYVRHTIKPLAYLRYGDDFVLFAATQLQARQWQYNATSWLVGELSLRVHANNNVIIRANQGLRFLGHIICPFSPLSVDKAMRKKIRKDINFSNASSYRAMHLPARQAKQLPWLLL